MQELLTRKNPFYYLRVSELIFKIMKGHILERPSIEDTCSRMSNMWWDMCTHCWNYDPPSRPMMTYMVGQIEKMVRRLASSRQHHFNQSL